MTLTAASTDIAPADGLSAVFGALADPTRRAILARLATADGDLSVGELKAAFPISQPAVSRHLKVLEHAGLITRSRRATARLSRIDPAPLQQASDWLARYRALWEERYQRLDQLLATLQEADTGRTTEAGPARKEQS